MSDSQAMVTTDPASPEAVFARLNQLRSTGGDDEERYGLYADGVVIEFPFAPQGRPRRLVRRAALREFYDAAAARTAGAAGIIASSTCRTVRVYPAGDGETIAAEFDNLLQLTGRPEPVARRYVAVMTVKDRLITLYRDYYNPEVPQELAKAAHQMAADKPA